MLAALIIVPGHAGDAEAVVQEADSFYGTINRRPASQLARGYCQGDNFHCHERLSTSMQILLSRRKEYSRTNEF